MGSVVYSNMNYIAGVVERARSHGDEELYRAIVYGDF